MSIQIHDNFYENDHCQEIYDFVNKSYFKIGWEDSDEPQHKPFPNLHSIYSKEDLKKIKILEPVLKKFKIPKDNYLKCIVNLTKPLDVNFIHVHPNMSVALYYANLTWNPEWGGETMFYKKDKCPHSGIYPIYYTSEEIDVVLGVESKTIETENYIIKYKV